MILFADDTSIVISNTSLEDFNRTIKLVMLETSRWFQSNLLSMNYDKTYFLLYRLWYSSTQDYR
jgi:hypothetical protein